MKNKKTVRGMVNGVMKDKHYLIALYVDDLIIACSTPQTLQDEDTWFYQAYPRYGCVQQP